MYAKNVSAGALKEVAESLNFEAETDEEPDRHRIRFRLKNKSDKYWVISDGIGRQRVMKQQVCYHGHYEFLKKLFQEYPDAIVEASWYKRVRYDKDNFEELAEEVGDIVIRQFDQLTPRDRCRCEREVYLNVQEFIDSLYT